MDNVLSNKFFYFSWKIRLLFAHKRTQLLLGQSNIKCVRPQDFTV